MSLFSLTDTLASRYKTDPQIKAMTDLVDAYQRREVHSAEKILQGKDIFFIPNVRFTSVMTR